MKEYTISELQVLMDSGELSSEKLVKLYLEQIQKIDKMTNAILEVNPDAVSIAKALDEERKAGKKRGLLHGIPLVLKDNIDTRDQMMTTAGSLALVGHYPKQDAFIVKKLREAGAVILAKANLSEWANLRGQKSISGWSSRGGQTRNPYALDRTPCGSSSGSAVAVAANLCTVAVGTETDGSIICPSQINGIVGVKPTMGLVSRSGIIPISHTQDTAGPMARTVKDAGILLHAISGNDESDPVTQHNKFSSSDFLDELSTEGLRDKRLGVLRSSFGGAPKVDKLMGQALTDIEKAGGVLIDPVEIQLPEGSLNELEVLVTDYKEDLKKYLEHVEVPTGVNSIQSLIKFNERNQELVMPYFGQEFFSMALESQGFESESYKEAMIRYDELRSNISDTFETNSLDAIIFPSGNPAWLIDYVNGDCSGGSSTFYAAVSGFPSITVPAGYIQGLPTGVSFLGLPFTDYKLIKVAYAYEQQTLHRTPPKFLNSV